MSTSDALIGRLTQLFHDDLNLEIADADQNLIDEGLLDSLSLVEMLLILEQEFGVEVSILDVDFEAFSTVRNIARFVAGITGEAGAEPAERSDALEPAV